MGTESQRGLAFLDTRTCLAGALTLAWSLRALAAAQPQDVCQRLETQLERVACTLRPGWRVGTGAHNQNRLAPGRAVLRRRADEGPGVLGVAWRSCLDSQSRALSPAMVTGGKDREPGHDLALGRYLVDGWIGKE